MATLNYNKRIHFQCKTKWQSRLDMPSIVPLLVVRFTCIVFIKTKEALYEKEATDLG